MGTLRESDLRFGGGPLDSIPVPALFGHIKEDEIIEVNRDYWKAFTERLTKRMRNTLKACSQGIVKRSASSKDCRSSILDQGEASWLATELRKENRVIGSLLFKSSGSGKIGEKFREKCDGKGETITVIQDSNGHVFGGYTSRPWDGTSKPSFHSADSAWLFKLRHKSSKEVKRINIKPDCRSKAVFDGKWDPKIGPLFGLDLAADGPSGSFCKQHYYSDGIISGELSKRKTYFTLKQMEVFQVVEPE